MESGALDGRDLSTSFMFERWFNWFPIHVEASRDSYAKLKFNRPQGLNIHAALCNETKVVHYLQRHNGSAVDGILEFMEHRFITRFHKYWYRTRDPALVYEMQCVKVNYLFDMMKVKHIDVWVLDIEGAELAVLKSMDWNAGVTIDVILLETMRRNDRSASADETTQILTKLGYRCHAYMSNEVCVHERFTPSKKPGIAMPNLVIQERPK